MQNVNVMHFTIISVFEKWLMDGWAWKCHPVPLAGPLRFHEKTFLPPHARINNVAFTRFPGSLCLNKPPESLPFSFSIITQPCHTALFKADTTEWNKKSNVHLALKKEMGMKLIKMTVSLTCLHLLSCNLMHSYLF